MSAPIGAPSPGSRGLQLACSHLAGPLVALDFEPNLLPLPEGSETASFDCRDVDEDVSSAVVRLDEAEALLPVEPFHSADLHIRVFQT